MTLRVAINGYGRIGRCVLRAAYEAGRRNGLRVVTVNDVADPATLAHLTRYDSTHGRFPGEVELAGGNLHIEGDVIELFQEPDVAALRWPDVDLVMECSGAFHDVATARLHLENGAGRVLFSQPAQSDVDITVVYGVNHEDIPADATVLSNASCTTNCIVPVLKVLDDAFGLEAGAITTIHSAMNDQPVIDSFHDSDLRKTRSAMQSIIPVDTALARGIARILPEMAGKLEARAIRVPTVNVSAMDVSLRFVRAAGAIEVNDAIIRESRKLPANVLGYTREPLASCDINHDPRSAVVDLNQTREIAGLVKVFIWFDNEWAYANRMLDVAEYLHAQTS
ncbi:MAG: erythrose-4-phosphate dehydrogenase [Gammaproteobacteria bacterium]|nr:erythrose-4-phosphate dehydrogenase [Gammaproteobacteria bacterium]